MTKDWVKDINDMHNHYGFHEIIDEFDDEKLEKMLEFRVNFLKEELTELRDNMHNPEEVVDALIDLCVVAIGTLDLFKIDAHKAWDEVHKANMAKELGIKEGRPNPLGLPDLKKPDGWKAPSHEGNHGTIPKIPKLQNEKMIKLYAVQPGAYSKYWAGLSVTVLDNMYFSTDINNGQALTAKRIQFDEYATEADIAKLIIEKLIEDDCNAFSIYELGHKYIRFGAIKLYV